MHNLKFYDCEVFPNWWCVVCSDEEEHYKSEMYHCQTDKEEELAIKSKMRVYTSEDENVVEKLREEMSYGIVSGYNNKRYDNIIIKCIMCGFGPKSLYKANNLLINPESVPNNAETERMLPYLKYGWDGFEGSQDFLDDSFKSLKDKESSYGLDIRETTVPFGKTDLTEQEKKDIIYYCKHDVYSLHVHYSSVARAYVDTKIQLCDIFGIPKKTGYQSTNAILSGKVLGATRAHGTSIQDPTITIRDKALDNYFKKYIPAEVYKHLLTSQEPRTFDIYDNKVEVADGGLHSVLSLPKVDRKAPGIYIESTDEYTMFNIDASSCYTSVMLYCDAVSRGIKNPKRLAEIYQRRMRLKVTPKSEWSADDKYFVNAGKLVLNTTYGAMGNKYLPLYDEYMRTKTCRIGQMVLIAVANALYVNVPGLKVIQNNTDGVLVYAKRSQHEIIQKLVDEFSEISKFIFEVEEDSKLWQLNVNNYIAISPEGKMKDKGGAFVHDIHQPGYYHIRPLSGYVIPKAQIEYYRNNINPIKTLLENQKVSDFVVTCTKGPGYYGMTQYTKSGEVELGKVARAIAVEDENLGKVVKRKWAVIKPLKNKTVEQRITEYLAEGKRVEVRDGVMKVLKEDTTALCPTHALIVNDALYNYRIENLTLIHKDGRRWKIDYKYYVNELEKALDVVWYKIKNDSVKITREFNL